MSTPNSNTPKSKLRRRPVVLIVRDGWGKNPDPKWNESNAVHLAKKPVDDALTAEYPSVLIATSGEDVGLPDGVMGNSEVGHQNIGAGRIVDQEVMRITRAIRDESFFSNPVITDAIKHVKESGGRLHVLGLMSDGRVHSDLQHAMATIDLAKRNALTGNQLAIHAITDGRDTSPHGGLKFVAQLEEKCKQSGVGVVASVIGRFYAMDRDLRWERVQTAYEMLTKGTVKTAPSPAVAIQNYYDNPTDSNRNGDEFIEATSIVPEGGTPITIQAGDAVIFINYRGDRTREITKAFTFDDVAWKEIPGGGFDRGEKIDNLFFATMTGYETGLPVQEIFQKPPKMPNILGEVVASNGLKQFRCAETEKYPHVTFFFNDYRDDPFGGENWGMAASPRDVSTYDQKPEMSAEGITEQVIEQLKAGENDVYIVNFANGDMVGHTGVVDAAVQAVEKVDNCVGRIVEATLAAGGSLVVTADHGNCEQMIDPETGGPHTAHTTYTVPLIVVDPELKNAKLREGGRLADIAPTVLGLLGIEKPNEMTGQSLVEIG